MVMHPAKIYSTILGPIPSKYTTLSRDDLRPSEDNTKLVIHDLNWTPIQCPIFPYLKTMKYLGVQLDLRDFQHSDSHKKTLDIINTHLSHLLVQPGSPGAKIDYILFKLIPIVMNTAICANWTLNQYRELDTPFSKTYKLLLSLPRTFPSAILYLPRSMMAVGLPRFSDKAQVMKWEALIRCLAVRGDPAQSVNDFLDRLPPSTTSTKDHLRTLSSPAHWPPQRRYTARSMIEWFDQSGVSPCVRTQQESDPSQSIQDFAEHHRLWPSDWYGEEDNENLPPLHLIATDGSFTITPEKTADILKSEHDLRCTGKGAAGIVLIPPNYQESTSPPPLGVQIISKEGEPGMNAFTWELTAQVVALHLSKYQHNSLQLTSDCTSAITITNKALRARNDVLANERGGLVATSAHEFANSEKYHKRHFVHTKAHPERNQQRTENPTLYDKAILMADAMAGKTKAVLGDKKYPLNRHVLRLDTIFDEIIPAGQWHLRTQDDSPFPVMGDILPFQHRYQLDTYCANRDRSNTNERWASTAYAFADKLHPLQNQSYWTAARRAVIAFDWIGHGRNRAKSKALSQEDKDNTNKCRLCRQPDTQSHCMLECSHHAYHTIRQTAQDQQTHTASELFESTRDTNLQHFIHQVVDQSWTPSDHTSRLWLGMWNQDTLDLLLQQSLDSPLTMSKRRLYITTARKLIAPLLKAYTEMQAIINSTSNTPIPTNNSTSTTTLPRRLSNTARIALENAHIQQSTVHTQCILNDLDSIHNTTVHTLSDAAFALTDAADDT
jgi:hypothetical protein